MASVRTLHNLFVPEEKNVVFVRPEFSRWPLLLLENKRALRNLPNHLRSRRELLDIAADYTQMVTKAPELSDNIENIMATGHQATWHHCGILAKDIITSRFAESVNGTSIHLVLDHDICDTAIVSPKCDSNGCWYLERVEVERKQSRVPLELRPAPSPDTIKAFLMTVRRASQNQFSNNVWSTCKELRSNQMPSFNSIADFITYFQAILRSTMGINMAYLPVSLLSQSRCFVEFATSIIENASVFVRSYNEAILKQIDEESINSREAIRPLSVDSPAGLMELPFWLLLPDGRRESLFVVIDRTNGIGVGTASAELGRLDSACLSDKTDQLKNILRGHACCLRPKAVLLTLFTRLFLVDWFVHGTGGARYEYITDHILEGYYGIRALGFGVATVTAVLPLADTKTDTQESVGRLKQQLRNLKHNPEMLLDGSLKRRKAVKSLIIAKKSMIQESKNRNLPAEVKKSAWRSISKVNGKLLKYAEGTCQSLETRIGLSENREMSKHVRDCREYFFGLFPEEMLRDIAESVAT